MIFFLFSVYEIFEEIKNKTVLILPPNSLLVEIKSNNKSN